MNRGNGNFVPRGGAAQRGRGHPQAGGRGQPHHRGGRRGGRGAGNAAPHGGRGGAQAAPTNPPPAPVAQPQVDPAVAGPVAVTPAAAPPPKKSVDAVVKDAIRQFKVRVPEELMIPARGFGLAVEIFSVNGNNANPHELLAAARRVVDFYALCDLVANGHRIIDLWYGSMREETVIRYLNSQLVKAGYEAGWVTVQNRHGPVIPLDYGRRPTTPPTDFKPATAAYFCDVYLWGSAENPQEIDPSWISSLPYDEVIWAGHHFPGYYGAVLTAAWIRKDGKIHWSPDEINPVYPPHFPCDKMHTTGADGRKAWKIARVLSYDSRTRHQLVYNSIRFYNSALVSTPQNLHVRQTVEKTLAIPDFTKMLFEPGTWAAWLNKPIITVVNSGIVNPFLPKKTVKINLAHFQEGVAFLSARHTNGFSYQALLQRIQSVLSADEEWEMVNSRFPEFFGSYAEDLALAVLIDRAVVRAATLSTVREAFAGSFRLYSESVKNINEPTTPTQTRSFACGSLLISLVGFWGMNRYLRPTVGKPKVKVLHTAADFITRYLSENQSGERLYRGWEASLRNFVNNAFTSVGNTLWRWASPYLPECVLQVGNLRTVMTAGLDNTLCNQYRIGPDEITPKLRKGAALAALLVAPAWEEAIKRIGPWWANLFMTAIVAQNDLERTPYTREYDFLRAFAVHAGFRWLAPNYICSVIMHSMFNAYGMYSNGVALLEDLMGAGVPSGKINMHFAMMSNKWMMLAAPLVAYAVQRAWEGPSQPAEYRNTTLELMDELNLVGKSHPSIPGRKDWVTLEKYPVEQAFFPSQEIGVYPIPQADPGIECKVHMETRHLDEPRDGFYRWFTHPVPLFRPNNSTWNMQQMCEFRLLRAVPEVDNAEWYALALLSTLALSGAIDFHRNGLFRDYDAFRVCASKGAALWNKSKKKPGVKTDLLVVRLVALIHERAREALRHPVERFPISTPFGWFSSRHLDTSNEGPFVALFPLIQLSDELWSQWLEHVEARNVKLYQKARDELLTAPLHPEASCVLNIQVNQKRDEVLVKMEEYDPMGALKEKGPISRPIHAVDKKPTVEIGPYVYEATNRLKSILFNHCAGEIGCTKLYWTWGSGRTDLELTLWWDFVVHNGGWHLIVAGDDMLLVHTRIIKCPHNAPMLTFFEGDLSQCDHTSRIGCLFAEYCLEHVLGVPLETIRLQVANARAKLTIGNRNQTGERIEIFRSYERNTGGTDTTFGNSSTSLLAATYALLNCKRPLHVCSCCYSHRTPLDEVKKEFVENYETLGLSLKLRITEFTTLDDVGITGRLPTFLKGTWYPCEPHSFEGRVVDRIWGPLPSRLLKMCKTLSDPRVTMKRTGEKAITLEVGLRRFAESLAYSMKDFMWPYGIKRWLVRLSPQSVPPTKKSVLTDSYILQQMSGSFPRSAATLRGNHEMAVFYNIETGTWLDFMEHLQQIKPFTFSEHPVWYALASDYA